LSLEFYIDIILSVLLCPSG